MLKQWLGELLAALIHVQLILLQESGASIEIPEIPAGFDTDGEEHAHTSLTRYRRIGRHKLAAFL